MNTVLAPQTNDRSPAYLFALLRFFDTDNTPEIDLAVQAGYAESTARTQLARIKASPDYQRAMTTVYRGCNIDMLKRVLDIRQKALDKYDEQPELAIERPKLLETVDRIAGVLQDEQVRPAVINIGQLNVLQQGLKGYLEPQEHVPEAEIVGQSPQKEP